MKATLSLIVLQCLAACCSGATAGSKYLGVPASLYPLRTALDVLQPTQGRLAFSHAHLGHAYYPGYPLRTLSYPASTSPLTVAYPSYPGYPGAFLGLRSPALFSAPLNVVQVQAPTETAEEPIAVDVAEEEVDDGVAPAGEITIREHVDSLPSLPQSPFRDSNPVIPAGIVQATQPKFVQTIFTNPKVSPSLQFVINSKVSPVLQEIKASGVELF